VRPAAPGRVGPPGAAPGDRRRGRSLRPRRLRGAVRLAGGAAFRRSLRPERRLAPRAGARLPVRGRHARPRRRRRDRRRGRLVHRLGGRGSSSSCRRPRRRPPGRGGWIPAVGGSTKAVARTAQQSGQPVDGRRWERRRVGRLGGVPQPAPGDSHLRAARGGGRFHHHRSVRGSAPRRARGLPAGPAGAGGRRRHRRPRQGSLGSGDPGDTPGRLSLGDHRASRRDQPARLDDRRPPRGGRRRRVLLCRLDRADLVRGMGREDGRPARAAGRNVPVARAGHRARAGRRLLDPSERRARRRRRPRAGRGGPGLAHGADGCLRAGDRSPGTLEVGAFRRSGLHRRVQPAHAARLSPGDLPRSRPGRVPGKRAGSLPLERSALGGPRGRGHRRVVLRAGTHLHGAALADGDLDPAADRTGRADHADAPGRRPRSRGPRRDGPGDRRRERGGDADRSGLDGRSRRRDPAGRAGRRRHARPHDREPGRIARRASRGAGDQARPAAHRPGPQRPRGRLRRGASRRRLRPRPRRPRLHQHRGHRRRRPGGRRRPGAARLPVRLPGRRIHRDARDRRGQTSSRRSTMRRGRSSSTSSRGPAGDLRPECTVRTTKRGRCRTSL
jgi:hypothetical protein